MTDTEKWADPMEGAVMDQSPVVGLIRERLADSQRDIDTIGIRGAIVDREQNLVRSLRIIVDQAAQMPRTFAPTLAALASIWRDHPEYDSAWALY